MDPDIPMRDIDSPEVQFAAPVARDEAARLQAQFLSLEAWILILWVMKTIYSYGGWILKTVLPIVWRPTRFETVANLPAISMPRTPSGTSRADRDPNLSYGASVELFSNASDVRIEGSSISVNVTGEDRMRNLEARLRPSRKANHRHHLEGENLRRTACTEGTRVRILSDIMSWATDVAPADATLYWLFGAAGSGKSTIAFTIADQLDKMSGADDMIALGGTFFCSRQFPETKRASYIIPSLVYRLALKCGAFADALNRCGNFDTIDQDIRSQLEGLLITPWLESESARLADPSLPLSYVLVIDALDEIDGKGGSEFLSVLLDAIKAQRLPGLKFFATSRPDPVLVDKVESFPDRHFYRLEQVPFDEAQNDIRTYLTMNLVHIPHEVTERLVTLAAGLFIYAATILKYLQDYESLEQEELLDGLLSRSPSEIPSSSGESSMLNELYHRILDVAFRGLEDSMRERRLQILYTFLCTAERTSTSIVAQLLNTSSKPDSYLKIVNNVLDRLHAVLYSDGDKILWYHKSFPDFIFAQTRSKQFWCDEAIHHQHLTEACFRIMHAGLRFNIANIQSSYMFDDENVALPDEVERNISPVLRYACRHWSHHLPRTSAASESLFNTLADFLRLRVLFWIEAMNLLKLRGLCDQMLRKAGEWASKQHNSTLAQNFGKAATFAVYFCGNPTSQSTPHLYISALATSPQNLDHWRSHFPGIPHFTAASQQANTLQLLTLRGPARVVSVAMSTDCNFIVSGSSDNSVRVWDASTGEQLKKLEGHSDIVTSVAFSTNGTRIVSGSGDKSVRVWDASTGEQLTELLGHTGWVNSVAFSTDGKRVVSGSRDRSVRVWDALTGGQLKKLEGHHNIVTSLAFSTDGKRIVSGSTDRSVRVWDALTGKELIMMHLLGHPGFVISVAFSTDGKRIVSSDEISVRVWDALTGEKLNEMAGHIGHVVKSVAFSTDGNRIVSGSCDNTVRVWDASTGRQLKHLEGHTEIVTSVAFSTDGTRIVSGSDNSVRVWDASTGEQLKNLMPGGHTRTVRSVVFSSDGQRIVSGSDDTSVRVWDALTGKQLMKLEGHVDSVISVAISTDDNQIVSSSADRSVRVWNASTGKQLMKLRDNRVASVAFSTNGNLIASGSADKSLRVRDASTGEQLKVLHGHTGHITSVAFSTDGKYIVSGSGSYESSVRVWEASTGKQLKLLMPGHLEPVISVAFSTDGKIIVSRSADGEVRVWNASSGRQLPAVKDLTAIRAVVTSVAFSPDNKFIVSGYNDKAVRVWDASTGRLMAELWGHTDNVTSVAFSTDGNRIVSGSRDTSVRVWGALTAEQFKDLEGGIQVGPVTLDGQHIVSGSADRVWYSSTRPYCRDRNNKAQYTGWLLSPLHSHRLMFVPPDSLLPSSSNILTIPSSASSSVDFSHAKLGRQWHQCYRP